MVNAKELKKQIYEKNLVEELLEKIGMHHIQVHSQGDYFTCGMPDGDNNSSTTIYNDEYLSVVAYTRNIGEITDIISLVQYTQNLSFQDALKWIIEELKLSNDSDIYGNYSVNKTSSQNYIEKISKINETYKNPNLQDESIQIYDENILDKFYNSCYGKYTDRFAKDNISPKTQRLFNIIPYLEEVGINWYRTNYNEYDLIPVYDEIGNLVGIKARQYGYLEHQIGKYTYKFLPCEKSKILYGLYFTKDYINKADEIIICESEKGVMQLWEYGYKNAVAVSGHSISNEQIKKIVKLNIKKVVIAFDKDIKEHELYYQYEKLKDLVNKVVCIIDTQNILDEKESPMDNPHNWKKLYQECQFEPTLWGGAEGW